MTKEDKDKVLQDIGSLKGEFTGIFNKLLDVQTNVTEAEIQLDELKSYIETIPLTENIPDPDLPDDEIPDEDIDELPEPLYDNFMTFYGEFDKVFDHDVEKVRIDFRNDKIPAKLLSSSGTPRQFADQLQKVTTEYMIRTKKPFREVRAFSSHFWMEDNELSYNFFVVVTGVDPTKTYHLPTIQVDHDPDPLFDKSIYSEWYLNRIYCKDAMGPDDLPDLKEFISVAKHVEGIILDDAIFTRADCSALARLLLLREPGTICFWRNTNLPDEYIEDFKDKGWDRVTK